MSKPPPSDPSRRGRPARPSGAAASKPAKPAKPARSGKPSTGGAPRGGAKPSAGRGGSRSRDAGAAEGPAWKRRADARSGDDGRAKEAGWGGVARRGAGRIRDEGTSSGASAAFRAASSREAWEPEVWIDEGVVREEASGAVGRGRAAGPSRGRKPLPEDDDEITADPSLRRAVGAVKVERLEERLKDASRAFRRERFDEARRLLRPLAEAAPTAESVRELLGLTYYRMGKWKLAAGELEAFRDLAGSTEQHPVLADCYRALGRHAKVAELWEELRAASPSAALVAEGRIVYAGSLADKGSLTDAIAVLDAAKPPTRKPQLHHLRVTYALADLHERAGDVPTARRLFGIVAAADPELGDVEARLRALR